MQSRELVLGSSGLLRVSGCPIGLWTEAASPDLFQAVRELNKMEEAALDGVLASSADPRAMEARAKEILQRQTERIAGAARELSEGTPAVRTMLRGVNPKAADHVWQTVARAATKSTPRGWLGHVALLPIEQDGGATATPPLLLGCTFAAEWTDSVHFHRHASWRAALRSGEPTTRIALAPLHWNDGSHAIFWVIDHEHPTRLVAVRLRQTALLEAVCSALREGSTPMRSFEDALLGDATPDDERAQLRELVEQLASLGVLEVSTPPRARLRSWSNNVPTEALPSDGIRADDRASLDVYRQVNQGLPSDDRARLQGLVQQALRVMCLITADAWTGIVRLREAVDERPRPVLDVLKSVVERPLVQESWQDTADWPSARDTRAPYGRLRAFLSAEADEAHAVDLSPALLDRLGAPAGTIDWPLDCLLRLAAPGSGFTAVLDQVFLAGAMDARFVPALLALQTQVPSAVAYRSFLEHLEAHTGAAFVELLTPPRSDRAAAAVRRPLYTRAWTGDGDLRTYCPAEHEPARYIPLEAIHLRRVDRMVVAESDGQTLWPLYHAARSPLAPWKVLADLLLAATPRPLRFAPRRLYNSLDSFPGRTHMPRITVGQELVLSCAQWRISGQELWEPRDNELAKVRRLERLRRRRNLPRWVFVTGAGGQKPVPCDLESLRAIRTLERACPTRGSTLLAVEMLPAPDQLLAREGTSDRFVSDLLLRLPGDETPSTMAARLAPLMRRHPQRAVAAAAGVPRVEALAGGRG